MRVLPVASRAGWCPTRSIRMGKDATISGAGGNVNDLTHRGGRAIILGSSPTGPDPREPPMSTRAVLFDFDGVIADTENVHVAAWQRTLGLMGWDEPDEACARAVEVDDRVFLAEVFARRKIERGDVDGWARRKQELTLRLLADAPRVYPGVVGLVDRLRGRTRLAIVSTTWRANVEAVLGAAGLLGAFEFTVGKEDVEATKPDPEGYRRALARLGLPASDVVALEDSPTGLAAARGAGLRAVAIGHRRPMGDWAGDAPFLPGLADPVLALDAIGIDPAGR